jgi:hypothetical protein
MRTAAKGGIARFTRIFQKMTVFWLTDSVIAIISVDYAVIFDVYDQIIAVYAVIFGVYALMFTVYEGIFGNYELIFPVYALIFGDYEGGIAGNEGILAFLRASLAFCRS